MQRLHTAPPAEAGPLRDDLARLDRDLDETVGRLAALPWDGAGARAALGSGDLRPAAEILAGQAALNGGPADRAARHFARAARLDPGLRSLRKARSLACMTGDLTAAFRLGQGLMVLAETSGTPEDRAMARAEHALTPEAQDRLAEAEGLHAPARAIFRATPGDLHPATLKVTKNFRALIAAHQPNAVHRAGVEALWAAVQQDIPGLGASG